MNITAFWNVTPCNAAVDLRVRGVYCLRHHPDDRGVRLFIETTQRHIAEGCQH
jgi:hypothetical protein